MKPAIARVPCALVVTGLAALCIAPAAQAAENAVSGPDCPADVTLTASSAGNHLSWTSPQGDVLSVQHIYRAEGEASGSVDSPEEDPAWTRIGSVNGSASEFMDASVTEGETYSYLVTFETFNEGESRNCMPVSITAIPFFQGPIQIALASLGAVGAVALLLRRRS